MSNRAEDQTIACSSEIEASPQFVFDVFTSRLGDWWPIAYTFSGPAFADAAIQLRTGGEWYERSVRGERASWGKVKAVEPGHRLLLEFGVGADRKPVSSAQSSTVEVTFEPLETEGTCVRVEHRDFARHGDAAQRMREGMASEQGWPLILAELSRGVRIAARENAGQP